MLLTTIRLRTFGLPLILFAAACGSVSAATDASIPDGSGDGPAGPCTPNTTTCASNQLTVCGSDGRVQSSQTCVLGCAPSGDRCLDINPSNALASELDGATAGPDAVFASSTMDTVFNADTGDVTYNGAPFTVPSLLHDQGSGLPQIRVFQFKSLAIRTHVKLIGTNAVALVSQGDVEISALVEIAGRYNVAAPGAISASSPCQGSDVSVVDPTGTTTRVPGAGGAALGTDGASGGNAGKSGSPIAMGGTGGITAGTVTLVPLRGGCRGGNVLSPQDAYWESFGGAGGGALQISSRTRITVTSTGVIDAGGGGANHGSLGIKSGSGGGSGGAILLEAPQVSVDGTLGANGGGGSCFNGYGQDGLVAYVNGALEALGAVCDASGGVGSGGNGGTKDHAPTNGVSVTTTTNVPVGGGGGGAAGRIRVNSGSGTFSKGSTSLVSPIASEAMVQVR